MQPKPTVDTLVFIPDEIVAAHHDEAARQVARSWARRPLALAAPRTGERTGTPERARGEHALQHDRMLVVAVYLALAGWAVCTGLWTWLAVDTAETIWIAFAGTGAVALLVGLVATVRFRPTSLVTASRRAAAARRQPAL